VVAGSKKAEVTQPTDERILITREFDAPRHLVYRAWTEPGLVNRWWGGERGEVRVAEIDLRVGGAWRCVMILEDGSEAAFRGEYREVLPNERIVSTEVYEGAPGAQALNTVTFEEREGRKTLTVLVEHASKEARDARIGSGMETGVREAMDVLERVAISLR
jgi:uncharacterized protein YndB with AHSA1/START domain